MPQYHEYERLVSEDAENSRLSHLNMLFAAEGVHGAGGGAGQGRGGDHHPDPGQLRLQGQAQQP